MKTLRQFFRAALLLSLAATWPVRGAVFTNDTAINFGDSAFDGQDIVVSNAVLTVDGPHAFNSLRVAAGATLTHSASANGLLPIVATATNEARQLTDSNSIVLNYPEVLISSIQVTDTNSLVTYTNGTDYVVTNEGSFATLQRTTNSLIAEGDTVLVTYDHTGTTGSGLMLTVTNDFELEPGASVNVDGRGFGGGLGTGFGRSAGNPLSGGGAGHGGNGGLSSSNAAGGMAYGSPFGPATLGSGGGLGSGGSGGLGGGKVQLTVGGNCVLSGLVLSNGQNATNSRAGGGAGGSIWITAQTISGAGTLSARGGAGEPVHGGGGGGGRIVLDSLTNIFTGIFSAHGGAGWQRGGAGTVVVNDPVAGRALTIDNGGFSGAVTLIDLQSGSPSLVVQGAANVVVPTARGQATADLIVRSNSILTTTTTNNATMIWVVTGNAVIEPSAVLMLNGRGSSPNTGSGLAEVGNSAGGGSGHGGSGGLGQNGTTVVPGGPSYGLVNGPQTFGSGGRTIGGFPGGAGGGALRFTVTGKLQLDGRISADATAASGNASGGASGGSVSLTLGELAGSGLISANGGNGGSPFGGGGAGGRIAVTCNSNSFTGAITAYGGAGAMAGGAGTIYTKLIPSNHAELRVDNGGLMGTNTDSSLSESHHLTITGGAALRSLSSVPSLGTVAIGPNSRWLVGPGTTTASNVIVAAGGSISADGLGFASGQGPGVGGLSPIGSTGGGHGGYGGRGLGFTNVSSAGGNVYDQAANPAQSGSGGGSSFSNVGGGGAGGGVIRLNVADSLVLDGIISAKGRSSSSNNSGGGAGGSVWLSLNRFAGAGAVTANGGSGHLPNGGGGAGGRIAIYWNSNSFTGNFSAKAGNGFVAGGAGTIYLKANQASAPSLILDNGGLAGTNTVLDIGTLSDLTLSGGVAVTPTVSTLAVSNLAITANSVLRVGTMNLTVSGAANIGAGAGIAADGTSPSSFPGAGQPSFAGSGGGGHGGYGGRGAGGTGGNVYGATANPSLPGSQGGGYSPPYGGSGGGYLRMTVTGPLILDGKISANGTGQTNGAGGGSGGSVWLTLNQFLGNGSITADGGAGNLPAGGGGGGGRIAAYYNTNAFTGTLSARGGNGFAPGGAGTIYLQRMNDSRTASLIADNGGLSGTNTVLDLNSLSNLTITGGAILKPNSVAQNITLSTFSIGTNSTLLTPGAGLGLTMTINVWANVAAGGSILGDGLGNSGGGGTGFGQTATGGSGGGGHGGYGGRGAGNAPTGGSGLGGNAYGSLASPTSLGSGGGGATAGGAGGGAIRINALRAQSFILNGRISANGANAISNNAGGGSGGSIWLDVDELTGAGSITADGGNGHLPNGGGGGGGRIALIYDFVQQGDSSNGFTGVLSAKGSDGFARGGAGTVFVRTNHSGIAQALVDNGGVRGTNTLVLGSGSYDLTVQGGAVATAIGMPRDVLVRSNGWLAPPSQGSAIIVSRNATFESGGGLNLDGLGNSSQGRGATTTGYPGGGGHGGYGGMNPAGSGNAYDSALAPTQVGSMGGNGSGTAGAGPFGGLGGGAARLTVGNTLLVDGGFSANGMDGEFNSGGGSGGSWWLEATTLAGAGQIVARGGNGNGTAGGGGGGRIAVYFKTNLFTGTLSACGGDGAGAGGAGTVFLRDNNSLWSSLLLDNCGLVGTYTPLSPSIGLATNLTVTGGAAAEMQGVIPAFSNLVVSSGGRVTGRTADTNLCLVLLGDLTLMDGAGIAADARGFTRGNGPGAGGSLGNQGAGGSHGGAGGESASGALSGADYGSARKPVERGSGGGAGSGPPANGSEGGGAIRLAVAGTVALDGFISAEGGDGWQDDAGGGAGGSVWLSTKKLTGHGVIAARGGDGEFFGGGGGGGGRVAIYSPTNTFTGLISIAGGAGADAGGAGTIFTSGILGSFEVVAQSPQGPVTDAVSQVWLEFNEPINPLSLASGDVRLYAPYGAVAQSNFSLTLPAPATLRIAFPTQNAPGDYRLEVGPLIEGLLAERMSQVYTGAFTAAMPQLSGTVTDTNGQPVTGVTLQPSGGLIAARTGADGSYSLGVPPNWNGTVTPSLGTFIFVPVARDYAGVSSDETDQNYQMVATIAASLRVGTDGGNLSLNWDGLAGITYQAFWSTNLNSSTWYPLDPPVAGTNGPMQLPLPIGAEPERYFRLNARN